MCYGTVVAQCSNATSCACYPVSTETGWSAHSSRTHSIPLPCQVAYISSCSTAVDLLAVEKCSLYFSCFSNLSILSAWQQIFVSFLFSLLRTFWDSTCCISFVLSCNNFSYFCFHSATSAAKLLFTKTVDLFETWKLPAPLEA